MIHEMTGKVFDKVKGVVAISIALAGMMLAGQAQAGQIIAGETHLTGDPVADGYTYLGNLHDTGTWVDSGFWWAGGTVPFNAALYTGGFTLTANDTASSVMGSFGSTPTTLTSVPSNTATTWQVGDEIFSIGVVAIDGASSGSAQHLFFGFNSDGDTGGHGTPRDASDAPHPGPSDSTNIPGVVEGRDGSGTGPGDLHTLFVNGSTNTGFDPSQGQIQFKDALNVATNLTPGGGDIDAFRTFFNGVQVAPNNAYFTTGLFLINKSEVERDWIAMGSDLNLAPESFADMIDFSLMYTGDAGGGMWNSSSPASAGVFFEVSTLGPALTLDVVIPEPASLALLGLGGLLMLRRRRTA